MFLSECAKYCMSHGHMTPKEKPPLHVLCKACVSMRYSTKQTEPCLCRQTMREERLIKSVKPRSHNNSNTFAFQEKLNGQEKRQMQ